MDQLKIKILHIADHLDGKIDGVFTHIFSIINNTDKNKFEHIVCHQGNQYVINYLNKHRIDQFVLEKISKKLPISALTKLFLLLKNNRVEIIHTHNLKPYFLSALLKIFFRFVLIYNYHGLFVRNSFYTKLEQNIFIIYNYIICRLKLVDSVFAPSKYSVKQILKETKTFPEFFVYYNGADLRQNELEFILSLRNKIGLDKNYKLVYAGRIASEKRIDRILQIQKIILNRGYEVSFYIVGEGEQKPEIERLASKMNLTSYVYFIDPVRNLQSFLANFDVLMITSEREAGAIVLYEALAAKLPVVATKVGSNEEIISELNCGYTFNGNELEKGANYILKLLKNPNLAKKLGYNGYKGIVEKYNTERFGKLIQNKYLELLEY